MSYSKDSSFRSPPQIGETNWAISLAKHGADSPDEIAEIYYGNAPLIGLNPDMALAQAVEETGWFTSPLWKTRRNPCGLGITGEGVIGLDYGTPTKGILAHLSHLCCYVYTKADCPVEWFEGKWGDPRHGFHDGNPKLSHLQEPQPGRRWAEGEGYVPHILAVLDVVEKEAGKPMTLGHVPAPPINVRLIGIPPKVNGVGVNKTIIPRKPLGSCVHSMVGTLWGTDGWFRRPDVQGLTDYGIGQKDMGGGFAEIIQWCDPYGLLIPWANGEATGVEGDGAAFIAKFGIDQVNRGLVSIELDDNGTPVDSQGRPTTPATSAQWSSLCWMLAYVHAEMLGQTAATFEWNMHHKEFATKDCPFPRIYDFTIEYQAVVREIMDHFQNGIAYDPVGYVINGRTLTVPKRDSVPVPTPPSPDPISVRLVSWYKSNTLEAQGSLDNAVFWECDVNFSQIYPELQGWQRAIRGEFLRAWFHPDASVSCIHPEDWAELEITDMIRKRV